MYRKFALAAAMFAGLMASAASAHHHQGFNFGADCGAWWSEPCFGGPDIYQWREDELGFRVSCSEARSIVRNRGYRNVRMSSCGVRTHSFTGLRHGSRYLIKVNGYNGDILSIRQIE
jgi:hypothetical protein